MLQKLRIISILESKELKLNYLNFKIKSVIVNTISISILYIKF